MRIRLQARPTGSWKGRHPQGPPRGRRGHSPCRVSYCLICTSSTQSAGNQPVRPFTVPSQKPPSPMLSTGGTEARRAVRAEEGGRRATPLPPAPPAPPHLHLLGLRLCPPTLHVSPSLPVPSFILLSFSLGKFWDPHRRQKRTDGHSTGWACGGQRDAQMDTLEGGTGGRGRDHNPTPALPADPSPPTSSTNPQATLLCRPPQGSRPRAQGHWIRPHDGPWRADPRNCVFLRLHGQRALMR